MRGAICFLMLYKSKNGWLWFFSASFVLKVCQKLTIIANNLINNSKQVLKIILGLSCEIQGSNICLWDEKIY